MKTADIIIIGGGVMGSSVAYNLLNDGYEGEILVFEKDKSNEFSSTPRSAGGFRQLYTTDINVQISRFSLQMYKKFPETMAVDGEKAEIGFQQRGYLFLGKEKMIPSLEVQLKLQHKYGVPSQLLDKMELLDLIPELNINDLAGGLFCAEDGYLDPYSVMQGYIRKAKHLGAEYIHGEVTTPLIERGKVCGIRLTDDSEYRAPIVINCAGAWSSALSEKIGLPLPIVPLKRQVFQFDVATPFKKVLPMTFDTSGVYFRNEGNTFICGYGDKVKPGFNFKWKRSYFTDKLWPILANRVPNFEKTKLQSGWAGLYAHNTIDHNAIIGEHPKANGYYLACGFSGHGMQQAPAVGKGISELIRIGEYETIDLSPLNVKRFKEDKPVIETAIF